TLSCSDGSLALLPAVTAPDILKLTLNPTGNVNPPEIVYVVGHTASANSANVIRACENTVTPVGGWGSVAWIHGPTRDDFPLDSNLVYNGDFLGSSINTVTVSGAGWTN